MLVVSQLTLFKLMAKAGILNHSIGILVPAILKVLVALDKNQAKVLKVRRNSIERLMFMAKQRQVLVDFI